MKGYNFRILQCSLLIDIENQKKKTTKYVTDRVPALSVYFFDCLTTLSETLSTIKRKQSKKFN